MKALQVIMWLKYKSTFATKYHGYNVDTLLKKSDVLALDISSLEQLSFLNDGDLQMWLCSYVRKFDLSQFQLLFDGRFIGYIHSCAQHGYLVNFNSHYNDCGMCCNQYIRKIVHHLLHQRKSTRETIKWHDLHWPMPPTSSKSLSWNYGYFECAHKETIGSSFWWLRLCLDVC